MSSTAKTNWFWSDWLGDPAVRRLSPAARGVWIDCLALMATACPVGYLCDDRGRKLNHEEIARVTNAGSPVEVSKLLAEILDKGVASVDRTGRVYNRRMVRAASIAAKKQRNGRLGGAATRLKWQAFSGLPQQNAWQMPQQNSRALSHPLRKKDKNLSSFSSEDSAAREEVAASPTEGGAVSPVLVEVLRRKGWA